MNDNLAEYQVQVNAEVGNFEIIFVDEDDDVVNPLGVNGLGEIAGKRVRDLPITVDKLL